MVGELGGSNGNYQQQVTAWLAAVLLSDGPERAHAEADRAAEEGRHGADYLMEMAIDTLLWDGDPAHQEAALQCMEWDAEHMPNAEVADGLTYTYKIDARNEETRAIAERMFAIAISHLINAAKVEGFVPTVEYIESAHSTLARTEEEGFRDKYTAAYSALAPTGFAAIEAFNAKAVPAHSGEMRHYEHEAHTFNEMLGTISYALDANEPDTAARARELMRDGYDEKDRADSLHRDHLVTQAFLTSDFDTARDILSAHDDLTFKLWTPMLEIMRSGPEGQQWGAKVLETFTEVKPNYFADYNGRSSIDIIFNVDPGIIFGIAGRSDIYEPMLASNDDTKYGGHRVAMGVAYGLGQTNNREAYEQFLLACPRFADIIHLNFVEGQQNPVPIV